MIALTKPFCAFCGFPFSQIYTDKFGYTSKLKTKFCSKSCATYFTRHISSHMLVEKAIEFIKTQNKYCSKEEICSGTNHSSKTFRKHGISFIALNLESGFNRPSNSKFQSEVEIILKENFSVVHTEKTFKGLVGTKGHPLRVDFYLPEINTVVEADGSQHSDHNHPWHEWRNGTVRYYDELKNEFFEKENIRLVRIPYKRSFKKDYVLNLVQLKQSSDSLFTTT